MHFSKNFLRRIICEFIDKTSLRTSGTGSHAGRFVVKAAHNCGRPSVRRKSPCFALGEAGASCISRQKQGKHIGDTPREHILPSTGGVFLQIHGGKFKLHPVSYLGQASVSRISHAVMLLGIGKDPFNGLCTSSGRSVYAGLLLPSPHSRSRCAESQPS